MRIPDAIGFPLLTASLFACEGGGGGSFAAITNVGGDAGGADGCVTGPTCPPRNQPINPPPAPVKGTVTALSRNGGPSGRVGHSAVWTGKEMIIWGGSNGTDREKALADGAAYDPKTDAWRPIATASAPSARAAHKAVWTGKYMAIVSADVDVLPEKQVEGHLYDPSADTWKPINAVGAPSPRAYFAVIAVSGKVVVWGGNEQSKPTSGGVKALGSGGIYDPDTDTWTPTNESGAPSPLAGPTHAVDANGSLLVFGGINSPAYPRVIAFGSRYDLAAKVWTALPSPTDPKHQFSSSLPFAWTGSKLVYISGFDNNDNTGFTYGVSSYDLAAGGAWAHVTLDRTKPICAGGRVTSWSGKYMVQAEPRCIFNPDAHEAFSMPPVSKDIADQPPPGDIQNFVVQAPSQVWTGTELLMFGGRWTASERMPPCPEGAPCAGPAAYEGFALGARYVIGD